MGLQSRRVASEEVEKASECPEIYVRSVLKFASLTNRGEFSRENTRTLTRIIDQPEQGAVPHISAAVQSLQPKNPLIYS